MARDHRALFRRLFATAHKVILKKITDPLLKQINGDVLIVGAGREPYEKLLPNAGFLVKTDIGLVDDLHLVADAHDLPFCDSSFDFFVAIEVFEHLANPKKAAGEIARVLRDGGEAIISIPFMFRIHADPHDYQRLTRSGLEELFGGFSNVCVEPYGNRLHVISDILTTGFRVSVVLRLFNHILTLSPLRSVSEDCPSGYVVKLRK